MLLSRLAEREQTTAPIRWVRCLLLTAPIILLAMVLRVYRISAQSIWPDEGYSIALAGRPVRTIIETVAPDHTPFYYLLMHFWILLAGNSEFAARFASLIFGVLLVATTYRAAADWFGAHVAILGAVIAAASPMTVYYSQEARSHIQAACLVLLSILLLVRAIRGRSDWYWVAYAGVSAAAIYSFIYASLVIPGVAIALVALRVRRSVVGSWVISTGVVGVLLSPWLMYDVPRILAYIPGRSIALQSHDSISFASRIWIAFCLGISNGGDPSIGWPPVLALPLLPLLVSVLALVRKSQRLTSDDQTTGSIMAWACLLLPLILSFAMNRVVPVFEPRYLLIILPFCHILIAAGLVTIWRAVRQDAGLFLRGAAAICLLVSTIALVILTIEALDRTYTDPRSFRDDFRALVGRISRESSVESAIVLNADWQDDTVTYYLTEDRSIYRFNLSRPNAAEAAPGRLAEICGHHPDVWLVLFGQPNTDREDLVERWLDANAYKLDEQWYGSARLVRYTTKLDQNSEAGTAIAYRFAGGLDLIWHRVSVEKQKAQSRVTVELAWKAERPIKADYSAFVHILDSRNQTIAQKDGSPLGPSRPTGFANPGETVRDVRVIDLPSNLTPGRYTVEVGVYDSTTLQRSRVGVPNADLDDRVIIDTLQIGGEAYRPAECELPDSGWIEFAEMIRLDKCTISQTLQGSDRSLGIEVTWQALREIPEDYTAFFHLVSPSGQLVAQIDAPPGSGYKPTPAWPTGRNVADRLILDTPQDLPAEKYAVCSGFYRQRDLKRLPVNHGDAICGQDAARIATVQLEGSR